MKVQIKSSQCIGVKIREWVYDAEVVRINKRSIRVQREKAFKPETFRFVKTLSDGKKFYKNSVGECITTEEY